MFLDDKRDDSTTDEEDEDGEDQEMGDGESEHQEYRPARKMKLPRLPNIPGIGSTFNPMTTLQQVKKKLRVLDDASELVPNFLFRVHSRKSNSYLHGTRHVYSTGTLRNEPAGPSSIYNRPLDSVTFQLDRHLQWKAGFISPFISWSASLLMVIHRAIVGWQGIKNRNTFVMFLDLRSRQCKLARENVFCVTAPVLGNFTTLSVEDIKKKEDKHMFAAEVLTYGHFECEDALIIANWDAILPHLQKLLPNVDWSKNGEFQGMCDRNVAARKRTFQTLRSVTEDELALAILVANEFRLERDGVVIQNGTDPNLVLALLGCVGNVSISDNMAKRIAGLSSSEEDLQHPYPGQRNDRGHTWGTVCNEVATYQSLSDTVHRCQK